MRKIRNGTEKRGGGKRRKQKKFSQNDAAFPACGPGPILLSHG